MFVAVLAAPGHDEISVVSRSESVRDDGFEFDLQQSDGHTQNQSGHLTGTGEGAALAQTGHYEWTSPEGEKVSVEYVADENGFQPRGPYIPTPPPTPDYIVRLLKYLEEHGSHE